MGSPSARLKTPEKLRPWLESGLEFVFRPEGQATNQAIAQPQAHSLQQSAGQGETPTAPTLVPDTARPNPQQAQQHMDETMLVPKPDMGGFPEPWASFLKRTPAKPKVVWTYMELGLDLGGQVDPKRSSVLKNIINHHLRWPKGTTAFWPVSALNNGALQPNPSMFWKGWGLWKTPYIACFGEEALRVIHPEAQPGNTTYLLEHVTIFVLPPLAKLVTMLPHEQQLSVDQLSGIPI